MDVEGWTDGTVNYLQLPPPPTFHQPEKILNYLDFSLLSGPFSPNAAGLPPVPYSAVGAF